VNIEEARLYLEHTSKDDFNLEEWQKENRYQAIQVVLKEIERLNNIIKDIKSQLDYLETYSSKEDVFEDMKRRLDRIDKIISNIRT
jgi:predicted DNA-binding protein YlxM (UPF0122 family)